MDKVRVESVISSFFSIVRSCLFIEVLVTSLSVKYEILLVRGKKSLLFTSRRDPLKKVASHSVVTIPNPTTK